MKGRDEFIQDHLPELCQEILGWKKTGVLIGDRLRELSSQYYATEEHYALPLAEEAVKVAAMHFAIKHAEVRF